MPESRAKGVLVTRPAADGAETAALLVARGFEPVLAPLLRLHERPMAPVGRFDAIIVTSRNAVPALPEHLRQVTLLAVGSATASRARKAGFTTVLDADGDGAALANLATRRLDPGGRLLFAHGHRQGDAVADALETAGFSVVRACAYAVLPVGRLPLAAVMALEAGSLTAALFLSTETAEAFVRLLPARLHVALASVTALAIGSRAAAVLAPLPWRTVHVAFKPTLDDVLALL